jgi:zinc transport system ATP-binding protein
MPPPLPQPILTVEDLRVEFNGDAVLEDVSFSLERGRIAALIGPNGSGKTTLFKAILGLIPYAGSIHWAANITFGYVPQRFGIPRSAPISVREFFLLKSSRFWLPAGEFLARVTGQLSTVGLSALILDRPLGTLSGGQLQRVMVCWAMLNQPEVLLFDEPTASVDTGFGETIYQIMQKMRVEHGTSILFISHDLSVVSQYADMVLCLNHKILCQGPPLETLTPHTLQELFGEVAVYRHRHANA